MHADAIDEPAASISRVNTQKTPNTQLVYSSKPLILYISYQTTQHHVLDDRYSPKLGLLKKKKDREVHCGLNVPQCGETTEKMGIFC